MDATRGLHGREARDLRTRSGTPPPRSLVRKHAWMFGAALMTMATGCEAGQEPDQAVHQGQVTVPVQAAIPTQDPQAAPPLDGHFVPCPLYTAKNKGLAECATFAVPLDWARGDDGVHIDLFVKRIPAHAKSRGAIWLLAGGPGGAGDDLEWLADTLAFLQPDLDVYVPDHRGTGRSARLSCPTQEAVTSEGGSTVTAAEWPACIAALQATWGPGLQHFQTTAAARDLQALIEATRRPGQELYTYGVSYGTYWAMRWLALFPQVPTGVVLDGVCPPEGCQITSYDQHFDQTAHQILDRCGQDPQCAGQLGPDPWKRTVALFDALDQGWCQPLRDQGLDRKRLRNLLGVLLTDWELRTYLPAVVKRVERCTSLDVEAVTQLLQVFPAEGALTVAPAPLQSLPLGTHILLSEMYGREGLSPTSPLISLDQTSRMAALHDLWPRYQPDAAVGQWPQTRAPILMLNGTLDPQTPIAQARLAARHLHGAAQRLVTLPGAAHGTLTASPVDDSEQACGLQLLLGFLKAPAADPDLHCVDHLLPLDFQGDPLLSVALLGTTSTWGAVQVDGKAAQRARDRGVPAIERARRQN